MIAAELAEEARKTIAREYAKREFDLWFMNVKTPWYLPRQVHERIAFDAWLESQHYKPQYFTELFKQS